MSEFNQTADDLMTYLVEKADGKTQLSMLTHLTHFALDVIGKVSVTYSLKNYVSMNILTGADPGFDRGGPRL